MPALLCRWALGVPETGKASTRYMFKIMNAKQLYVQINGQPLDKTLMNAA
jgi:hypothetical protein